MPRSKNEQGKLHIKMIKGKIFLTGLILILLFSLIIFSGCEETNQSNSYIPTWHTSTDTTVSVGSHSSVTSCGTLYGKITPTKYSASSDVPIAMYWVKSEADCTLALNGQESSYYPSCSAIKSTYSYNSGECNVPSDSCLCLINSGSSNARVSIKIEKKI